MSAIQNGRDVVPKVPDLSAPKPEGTLTKCDPGTLGTTSLPPHMSEGERQRRMIECELRMLRNQLETCKAQNAALVAYILKIQKAKRTQVKRRDERKHYARLARASRAPPHPVPLPQGGEGVKRRRHRHMRRSPRRFNASTV